MYVRSVQESKWSWWNAFAVLSLCEETQFTTVLLGQLNKVGSESLGCFLHKFLQVNGTVRIQIRPLEDTLGLLVLQPRKAQGLQSGRKLVLLNLAIFVGIGQFKQVLENSATDTCVRGFHEVGNHVRVHGNDLSSNLVELFVTDHLFRCHYKGREDPFLIVGTTSLWLGYCLLENWFHLDRYWLLHKVKKEG